MKRKRVPYFNSYCAHCTLFVHFQKPFCCPKCGSYNLEYVGTLHHELNEVGRAITRLFKVVIKEVGKIFD